MRDPSIAEFPTKIWAELTARRARAFASWLRTEDDGRGYRPLREALAHYLSSSRGVNCTPDQIVVTSGVQQALDLLARLLLKQDDPVWMEDPGYFGAALAFSNAGATIIPVPVDEEGCSVSAGVKLCPQARGVYLTPAHQFPLGMTMSLQRRMEVLHWASRTGAFVIEDDYDSEYRFEGRLVPALQSLDAGSSVILIDRSASFYSRHSVSVMSCYRNPWSTISWHSGFEPTCAHSTWIRRCCATSSPPAISDAICDACATSMPAVWEL
jgi:GntR family transcriptional regulator/MocR family aminotransferase